MKRSCRPDNADDVVHIGTAGWTLPKQHAHRFAEGSENPGLTHLQRYSSSLDCVEVNSSFHGPHMRKTWERWAVSTPEAFRFSVKMPKSVTHEALLENSGAALQTFFSEVNGLGNKLGPVLVQLPPKLAFNVSIANEFLSTLRELHPAEGGAWGNPVVCEPRHISWFAPEADRLLRSFYVSRVAADPPKGSPAAGRPGGWRELAYWRLHGTPRTYYSDYSAEFLQQFARTLHEPAARRPPETWIIFDNTALGHATANALHLRKQLSRSVTPDVPTTRL